MKVDKKRPRIYAIFGKNSVLQTTRGDQIGEIRLLRAISNWADVYYNNIKVYPNSTILGGGDCIELPNQEYDLCYVRANGDLLERLPKPRLTMAYPLNEMPEGSYEGLLVTTKPWKQLLEKKITDTIFVETWYAGRLPEAKHIVYAPQAIDGKFIPEHVRDRLKFKYRFKTTGVPAIGFYGRLAKDTIPQSMLESIEHVTNILGSQALVSLLAGQWRGTPVNHHGIYLGNIPYSEMPSLLSQTEIIWGQECFDSRILGSGKILDAIGMGIPVLGRQNPVRVEVLGADYAGLFTSTEQAKKLLFEYISNDKLKLKLKNQLRERGLDLTPEKVGKTIYDQLLKIIA